MGTFHPFIRLPAELRRQIWGLTIAPRTVSIHDQGPASPAPMRACTEARTYYRESYTSASFLDPARPLWVHFGLDTIVASHYDVRRFSLKALVAIQRLQLEVEAEEMQDFEFVTCSCLRAELMRALEVVTVVVITDFDSGYPDEWTSEIRYLSQMNESVQLLTKLKNRRREQKIHS